MREVHLPTEASGGAELELAEQVAVTLQARCWWCAGRGAASRSRPGASRWRGRIRSARSWTAWRASSPRPGTPSSRRCNTAADRRGGVARVNDFALPDRARGGRVFPGRMARAAALVLVALSHWHWPVHGEVVRSFALPTQRYAAGGHRGIDIAAAPGTPVRAACTGRVTFAGTVPGSGRVVAQACGDLVASYTHLGALEARRGERLHAGVAARPRGRGAPRASRRPPREPRTWTH